MAVMAIGSILFISPMCSSMHTVESVNSQKNPAIFGMVMLAIGAIMRGVGEAGLAGSGIILDPEKAREDMEPWSRMKGGMVNDGLSEAEIVQSLKNEIAQPKMEVKVRCVHCRALNEEIAKFCSQCGKPV